MNSLNTLPTENNYLIQLISSVLHDEKSQVPPKELNFERLFSLASDHSVLNLAYVGLIQHKSLIPKGSISKMTEAYQKGIVKNTVQEYELTEILSLFDENNIRCMALKGSVIKQLYPSPDLRSKCDIDILIDKDNMNFAEEIMLSLSYKMEEKASYHTAYYKQPVMNVELHSSLISNAHRLYNYYSDIWNKVIQVDGYINVFKMSDEDYYIFMLVHLYKHFSSARTGIRSVIDIWVYLRHYKSSLDYNYIDTELKKIGLNKFNENIRLLAQYWFDNTDGNELLDEMTAFLFSNGTYGRISTFNMKFLEKISSGNTKPKKIRYILWRIFPGISSMKSRYPILKKIPFLLPLFWIIRIISTFFSKKIIKRELKQLKNYDKNNAEKFIDFYKKSGVYLSDENSKDIH